MLYHLSERKRCSDAIAALKIVHEKVPALHVTMFGTPKKTTDIPEYFDYYQMPDKITHNKIYNQAAIFIAASNIEGFGLPLAEAMTCGCALCCTDTTGFLDFAKDNITALTSPIYDVNALAENILKLINNNSLRVSIAKSGNEYIKQFSWNKAVNSFNNFLKSKL